MKKIKVIINIIIITIILFLVTNFILGWTWELRTNLKFKNFKPYDKVVLDALKLNEEDGEDQVILVDTPK